MSDGQQSARQLLPPPEIIDNLPSESLTAIAHLTSLQQSVLIALCRNTLSEIKYTDAEIAEECNTSREYIWQLRQNPKFGEAMGAVIKNLARGTQDKAFMLMMKHAEKDPGSVKTWLQIGGVHIDRRQNVNINANLSADSHAGTPESAIEASCHKFIAIGYDLERYVAEITATWSKLKAEGI